MLPVKLRCICLYLQVYRINSFKLSISSHNIGLNGQLVTAIWNSSATKWVNAYVFHGMKEMAIWLRPTYVCFGSQIVHAQLWYQGEALKGGWGRAVWGVLSLWLLNAGLNFCFQSIHYLIVLRVREMSSPPAVSRPWPEGIMVTVIKIHIKYHRGSQRMAFFPLFKTLKTS